MAGGQQTETVRGRVEQTNEKGLKLDGRWFNWSQYSRASVRPNEGDDVELEIARGKFINDARILGGGGGGGAAGGFAGGQDTFSLDDDDPFGGALTSAPPRAASAPPAAGSFPSRTASSPAPTPSSGLSATPNADRNTEIRRLALIKAAADYAAARDLDPEEVVTLASCWEEWVTGQSGPTGQR